MPNDCLMAYTVFFLLIPLITRDAILGSDSHFALFEPFSWGVFNPWKEMCEINIAIMQSFLPHNK